MWAVLPIKNLANVKTRLAPVLSPAERTALFRCMVHDVLSAVTAVQALGGVLIVTGDPDIQQIAAGFGAYVLQETANDGHSAAVARAASWLSARGESGLMQVPGDIPTVTAEELSDVLAAHGADDQRAFTIVPSLDHDGSNCVVCTPPDCMELEFGRDSFRRHVERARAAGIPCRIVERPGIALDVDNPSDLARLAATSGETRTHRFLEESGIGRRILRVQSDVKPPERKLA
jgi:2-phospho-L-lactate guanylyltransferase